MPIKNTKRQAIKRLQQKSKRKKSSFTIYPCHLPLTAYSPYTGHMPQINESVLLCLSHVFSLRPFYRCGQPFFCGNHALQRDGASSAEMYEAFKTPPSPKSRYKYRPESITFRVRDAICTSKCGYMVYYIRYYLRLSIQIFQNYGFFLNVLI